MTDTLFHDGQIFLSINDAVAMALENNLDITLQRYNLSIADTDLLLTSTGTAARGVNTSVVQGTQGGTLGQSPRAAPEARAPEPAAPEREVPRLA